MDIRDRYAIAGIGYTPQGKVPERTAISFYLEAAAGAIADAGLRKEDIDGLICYRYFPPGYSEREITPYYVAQQLGINPVYLTQEANCSRMQLYHAVMALASGQCNHVLVVYADRSLSNPRDIDEINPDKAVYGQFGYAVEYAMAARRAMCDFGTGPDTWKEIAVSQRRWAALNPQAALRNVPLSEDDYYSAEWVVEPFRRPDCCLVNDGGRAYILTTIERARDLKQPPVAVMGIGLDNPSSYAERSSIMSGPTGAKSAGERAFGMAGITTKDVDACQIYDCFTYTVEITLQDYGFFGPGEGREWFAGGRTAPGGSMPVNTSGGQLAEAHFMGLTPLTEAAMQLMGRCGERQLGPQTGTKRPEIIVCSDNGATLQSHCCSILRRL